MIILTNAHRILNTINYSVSSLTLLLKELTLEKSISQVLPTLPKVWKKKKKKEVMVDGEGEWKDWSHLQSDHLFQLRKVNTGEEPFDYIDWVKCHSNSFQLPCQGHQAGKRIMGMWWIWGGIQAENLVVCHERGYSYLLNCVFAYLLIYLFMLAGILIRFIPSCITRTKHRAWYT